MIANGLGPWWFPKAWRNGLTRLSSLFFDEASWRAHDKDYNKGEVPRGIADFEFLKAMVRDASLTTTLVKMLACLTLAFFFYTLVRAFGWASYNKD